MIRHDIARKAIPVLQEHRKIAFSFIGHEFRGAMKIALTVRRTESDLALGMQVALRDAHRVGGFENQVIFLSHIIGHESVNGATGYDDVVVLFVAQPAKVTFQPTATGPHKNHVVALSVAVEIITLRHRGSRTTTAASDVGIIHQGYPARIWITGARNLCRLEVVMAQRRGRSGL